VILGNVNSVTVYDKQISTNFDLGTQFYISKEDIGVKTRAQASIGNLIDLNPEVDTTNHEGEITEEFLNKFQVVVLANCDNQTHWNFISQHCRKQKIGLIDAQLRGLFSRIFVDFGETHHIKDHSGKEPKTFSITSISKEKQPIVRIYEKGGKIKQLEEGFFTLPFY
jgi:ubiquitin-activating enzyme E1